MDLIYFFLDDYTTSAYIDTAEERTSCCGSPDISIEYKETSNSKKYQKEMQYMDKNRISGQENGGIYSELYEQYARKERQVKPSEKPGKRPDWNINKPEKRYIPASERYPKPLQKQREENKVRRQMELLQLVQRNTPGNLCQKRGCCSDRSPSPHEELKNKGHRIRKVTIFSSNNDEYFFKIYFTLPCLDIIQALRIFLRPPLYVKNSITAVLFRVVGRTLNFCGLVFSISSIFESVYLLYLIDNHYRLIKKILYNFCLCLELL